MLQKSKKEIQKVNILPLSINHRNDKNYNNRIATADNNKRNF
jgi:hypothetical protein